MGKHGRKYKGSVPFPVLMNSINTFPVSRLLPIARVVCGTDYAVRYYYNKNHPKFYKNEEAFRHALRRCVATNAFDHCQQIIDYLNLEDKISTTEGDDNKP